MKLTFRKLCLLTLLLCAVVSSSHAATKSSKRKSARTAPHKAAITPAALHGKVLFARDGSLWIVDPNTRREQLLVRKPFEKKYLISSAKIAVRPDLKSVAAECRSTEFSSTNSDLWSVSLINGSVKRLTDTESQFYSQEPRFSPDGKQIVYTRRTGYHMGGPMYSGTALRIMNADGSNDRSVIGKFDNDSYFGAFWSRDGKRLLFTHYIGNMDYAGEVDNKQELQTCAIDGTDVQPFDGNDDVFLRPDSGISPDGLWKVSATSEGKGVSLRVSNTRNAKDVRYLNGYNELGKGSPQWTLDNKYIVFDSSQTYLDADKEGRPDQKRLQDIWSLRKDGVNLRRLASNATLIAVLP